MPRLPDEDAVGGIPSGISNRPIATYDQTAQARGAEYMGQGLRVLGRGVGQGMDAIGDVAYTKKREEDTLNDTKVEGEYLQEAMRLDDQIRNTTDPAELEALRQRSAGLPQLYAPRFTNPRLGEKFLIHRGQDTTKRDIQINNRADALNRDKEFADYETFQADQRALALDHPDKASEAIDNINRRLDEFGKKGWLGLDDVAKRKRSFAENYSISALSRMSPSEVISTIKGGEGALIAKESGGNPKVQNQFGYSGLYQFGAPRLATLGLYQPGEGENLQSWSKTSAGAPGKWSGTFNIPGFEQIKTIDQFLNSPEAQQRAFQIHWAQMDREIDQRGLNQYVGQVIRGIPMTRDAIKMMMHLGGPGGATEALAPGATRNASDANGATVLDYAKLAGNNSASTYIKFLDPIKRDNILSSAMREASISATERDTNSRRRGSETTRLINDDLNSVLHTGQPLEGLTYDRVSEALGEDKAQEWLAEREMRQQFHDKTWNWNAAGEAEIRDTLEQLRPQPGSPGFTQKQKLFEAAEKEADQRIEQRQKDPAKAANEVPFMRQYHAVHVDDEPSLKSFAAMTKQRLIAQDVLRIPDGKQRIFTGPETTAIWDALEQTIGSEKSLKTGLEKAYAMVKDAFGDDADRAFAELVHGNRMDKEQHEAAIRLLIAIAKGNQPTREDYVAVDRGSVDRATNAATAPLSNAEQTSALTRQKAAVVDAMGSVTNPPQTRYVDEPRVPQNWPVADRKAIDMLRAGQVTPKQFADVYGKNQLRDVQAIPIPQKPAGYDERQAQKEAVYADRKAAIAERLGRTRRDYEANRPPEKKD